MQVNIDTKSTILHFTVNKQRYIHELNVQWEEFNILIKPTYRQHGLRLYIEYTLRPDSPIY